MDKIEIKSSKWQQLLMLAVSLAFVAASVAMIFDGKWFGFVGAAFFGACAAIFVWQITQSGARLIVDELGIEDSTNGVGRIAWRDIRAAQLISISGNAFVALEVSNLDKYVGRLSGARRKLVEINRALGYGDLTVNLSLIKARPEEVFDLIMKYCEFDRRALGLAE